MELMRAQHRHLPVELPRPYQVSIGELLGAQHPSDQHNPTLPLGSGHDGLEVEKPNIQLGTPRKRTSRAPPWLT
jgi:hypothetical protein